MANPTTNATGNVSYMRIVEDVTNSGITQADLAKAVGATTRTVQNWTSGAARPRGKSAERLLDVSQIVKALGEVYRDEGIQIWLRSRNRNLGGRRPIELLAAGALDEVLAEVDNIVRGSK
jgi:DNA-binding transcriptional regulator YiaG